VGAAAVAFAEDGLAGAGDVELGAEPCGGEQGDVEEVGAVVAQISVVGGLAAGAGHQNRASMPSGMGGGLGTPMAAARCAGSVVRQAARRE